MQRKYRIVIEETVADEFEVEAKTKEEALASAIKKYRAGDMVLCPGELQHKQIRVGSGKWREF